jgi:polysaccharide pyruvyl transferase WcaK-like protein
MANKGTQALLKSDVSVIRQILDDDVSISVSTADVEGVRRLGLGVDHVLPTLVDIPYEVADSYAKRFGFSRGSLRYKVCALLSLFNMFIQMYLSLVSAALVNAGVKSFYREELVRCLKDSDVVLSCSDENFKETASLLPMNIYWLLTWWSMLTSKTWNILVAKLLGKPVVMLPNSVGPFRTAIGRTLSRVALNNCLFVLIRDKPSYGIVQGLSVRSSKILTSDTALLFEGSNQRSGSKGRRIGVSPGLYGYSLSEKKIGEYVSAHAVALDRAVEVLDVSVVFLPHYVSGFRNDDLQISKAIYDKMKHRERAVVIDAASVEEFKSLISDVDLVVSSKMHPCVLASSSFVPSLCVAYDHKQTGFFASLGMDRDVIPLQSVTSEKLFGRILDLWSRKDERRLFLEKHIPSLKAQVVRSISSALLTALKS